MIDDYTKAEALEQLCAELEAGEKSGEPVDEDKAYQMLGVERKTDTALRQEGMRVLLEKLGKVDAERFITLIIRESFDYTEWQRGLFLDKSTDELNAEAMSYYDQQHPAQ